MNQPPTILDFYHICYTVALNFPASYTGVGGVDLPHKRINGFAIINKESQINESNLGKDPRYIGKNLFFARSWINKGSQPSELSFEYPLFGISRGATIFKDLFKSECEIREVTFNLYIFDQMPGKRTTTSGAKDQRVWEEMEEDITNLMAKVLQSLNRFIKTTAREADNTLYFQGWQDRKYLEWLKSEGVIAKFSEEDELRNYFVQRSNLDGDTFPEAYNDNLGVFAMNFSLQCKSEEETAILIKYEREPNLLADI